VAATLLVFAQVGGFEFITYDDNVYVTENPAVQAGLTSAGFVWSFGAHECNWHPLTWLSLMLDAELWGLHPASFHLVNLALHAANVVLLFVLLIRLTDALYRSATVSLLFAVHPLHVESVAWVAERKDVLSTLFWLLTLHAYVSYARRPSTGRYALTAAAFAAGLLAKPMLVTLPVVLLLLDFWPLGRLVRPVRPVILEKLPLLALSVASSLATLYAQKLGGAVGRFIEYPLGTRLANAALSTIAYVAKAIWPTRLSVFYPYPVDVSPLLAGVCGALILGISIVALRASKSRPWVTFGWSWYVVTLLPVIGIIQVGAQGMADRYTYVPLVGLFVALCWELPALFARARVATAVAAGTVAITLGVSAHAQTGYWRDSVTLFQHALRVTTNNAVAESNLGRAFLERGDLDAALLHAREVIRIEPGAPDGHFNLGVILEKVDRVDEAAAAYGDAIRIAPGQAPAHLNLGIILARAGRIEEAAVQLKEAVRIDPESFRARNNLGVVLARMGALDEAIEQFAEAVRLDPTSEDARANLERARSARPL
jgi:Flp pilus assembly protein TadD